MADPTVVVLVPDEYDPIIGEVVAVRGPVGPQGPVGPIGPAGGVDSFNTRTGAVLPQSGDYTQADVGLSNVDDTSDLNKPVSIATQAALDGKVDENSAITGATKTKITYDAKGLVTSGVDATTDDIGDSTNKRYVTDANLTVINNTSGVNTGDQNLSGYELLSNKATSLVSPDNTKYPTTLAVQNAIDAIPAGGVTSFNSRTGAVLPQSGDYTKAMVGLSNVDNTSDLSKPISTATQAALDGKLDENTAIAGATKTKITYDAKGLITSGADATTADIADSANKRYVTDTDLTKLSNTSGINTGDQDLGGLVPYSGAAANLNLGTFTIVDASDVDSILPNGRLLLTDVAGISIAWNARQLIDNSGNVIFDYGTGRLSDTFGNQAIQLDNRALVDSSIGVSLDWGNRYTRNSTADITINWEARQLYESHNGFPTIDWDLHHLIDISYYSGDPVASWSGGFKVYNNTVGLVADFHTGEFYSQSSGDLVLHTSNRYLYDDYNVSSVDWNFHTLSTINATTLHWGNCHLNDISGFQSLDWTLRKLETDFSGTALDWQNRTLSGPSGFSVLDWATSTLVGAWTCDSALSITGSTNYQLLSQNNAITKKTMSQSVPVFLQSRSYRAAGTVTNLATTGFGSNASESIRILSGNNAAGGSVTTYYSGSDANRGRIGNNRLSQTFGSTDFGSKFRLYVSLSGVNTRTNYATDSFAFAWGTHYASNVTVAGITHIRDTSVPASVNYLIGFQILPGGLVSLFRKNGAGVTVASATLTTLTSVFDVGDFCIEHNGLGGISLYRNNVLLGSMTGAPTIVTESSTIGYAMTTTAVSLAREWIVQNLGMVWE